MRVRASRRRQQASERGGQGVDWKGGRRASRRGREEGSQACNQVRSVGALEKHCLCSCGTDRHEGTAVCFAL
eukprot:6200197-Pleurochrysis_carterae.AAC.2